LAARSLEALGFQGHNRACILINLGTEGGMKKDGEFELEFKFDFEELFE